jgi:hypothetical protein
MEKTGKYAWAAIGAFVALYDILGNDTLTASFKRGAENPRTKPLVYGALGVTALHLCGVIPREVDPFYLVIDHTPLREQEIDKGETI